jgi:hypothetical protein
MYLLWKVANKHRVFGVENNEVPRYCPHGRGNTANLFGVPNNNVYSKADEAGHNKSSKTEAVKTQKGKR